MKKTSYHVNPAVNKWEEEQRRARMEKMIQRAKSTLPPEARGGAKTSGPKKPSPYTAENNASKLVRKQSTGGQGTPSGAMAVNAQELDNLIYNRVQEILHMPLMRRAAAAKAALKGASPQKTPSSRGGRRPAWNNDWSAQTASAPSSHEERPIRGAAPRSGAPNAASERSPTKTVSSNARPYAAQGQKPTPTKGAHNPMPQRIDIPGSRGGSGALQRQPSGRTQGAGERIVLLPSPAAGSPANRAAVPRPSSSRYGSSAGAARAAASGSARGASDGGAAKQSMTRSGSAAGAGHSRASTSQVASSGVAAAGPSRPPLAPGSRASGQDGSPAVQHPRSESKAHDCSDDDYGDDFEEYDGTDDERGSPQAERDEEAEAEEGDDQENGPAAVGPGVALLRESVHALNGLVQMKIQQELVRSQHSQPEQSQHRRSLAEGGSAASDGGGGRQGGPGNMLASLALVGSEEPDARAHGAARGDLANSSLGDGLRQSDLEYLARLGGGIPHDGEVANSTDDHPLVIEPGAPAGTAKVWGDRQPWEKGSDSGATGLEKLRARQEREKARQAEADIVGVQRRSQAGTPDERRSRLQGQQPANQQQSGHPGHAAAGDEEDSVLLGETLTPRHRTGAAAQMQAVGDALAALASSGQLGTTEAHELRTQTDALYGSLVQLHNLMTGPRGAELCSSSPTSGKDGGAEGFSPLILSPVDSPSQSQDASPLIHAAAADGRGKPKRVDVERAGEPDDGTAERKPADGQGAGTHLQLTPKHRLIAEDVAWMAGLVHSLSKSLHVENGEVELPGQ